MGSRIHRCHIFSEGTVKRSEFHQEEPPYRFLPPLSQSNIHLILHIQSRRYFFIRSQVYFPGKTVPFVSPLRLSTEWPGTGGLSGRADLGNCHRLTVGVGFYHGVNRGVITSIYAKVHYRIAVSQPDTLPTAEENKSGVLRYSQTLVACIVLKFSFSSSAREYCPPWSAGLKLPLSKSSISPLGSILA